MGRSHVPGSTHNIDHQGRWRPTGALGGIGRVAATGQWTHPLSIIGYILGGLILLITLSVFVGWELPFIAND